MATTGDSTDSENKGAPKNWANFDRPSLINFCTTTSRKMVSDFSVYIHETDIPLSQVRVGVIELTQFCYNRYNTAACFNI